MGMVKIFCKDLGENDLSDLFLALCKRLESPTANNENNDTFKNSITKNKLQLANNKQGQKP